MENEGTETYRLLAKETYEEEDAQAKAFKKAKNYFSMDVNTGNFKGEMEGTAFSGKFELKNTSSGLSKGFYYKVALGYMSYSAYESKKTKAFFEQLSIATKLYFYPDNLGNPSWHFLEITSSENDVKVKLYKKAEVK